MVTENPAETASAFMKRGIALLNVGTAASLSESLGWFDQALSIRRGLPASTDPWPSYVLAASWMNRGDALTRLGGLPNLTEAVRSFDEALAVLAAIPMELNPLFGRRLAIAWINRGLALQEQGTAEALANARSSFERGIGALKGRTDQDLVLACGWMNRANVLMRTEPPVAAEARKSAEYAIALVAPEERADLVAAETGLKARHIFCQAIAHAITDEPAVAEANAATAIAFVKSGFTVAMVWKNREKECCSLIVSQLFRFGLALVQQYQPDAIVSFVNEGLLAVGTGGDYKTIELHELAVDALARVWRSLEKEGFAAIHTPRLDQWIETLRALRSTDTRLRELRAAVESQQGESAPK